MTVTVDALLALSFLISVLRLFMFIWAQMNGLMRAGPDAAGVIFADGEVGIVEDPSLSPSERAAQQRVKNAASGGADDHDAWRPALTTELDARVEQDRSSRDAAFAFLVSSVFWLLLGSIAGLIAFEKLTSPDFLTGAAWLMFGRVRTAHLNMVVYGWASMAGLSISLWMLPRLLKTHPLGVRYAVWGAAMWNAQALVPASPRFFQGGPTACNGSRFLGRSGFSWWWVAHSVRHLSSPCAGAPCIISMFRSGISVQPCSGFRSSRLRTRSISSLTALDRTLT